MADCPKCGRQLTVAGSCIKCGTSDNKSKWYAIAEEADAAEQRAQRKRSGTNPGARAVPASKSPTSTARADWYKAAGMDVPQDAVADRANDLPDNDAQEMINAAKSSSGDVRVTFIAIGAGVLTLFGGLIWWVSRSSPEVQDEAQLALPTKNIQHDRSYGYRVEPPDGFRQDHSPQMPEFARGAHGELTSWVAFRDAKNGVDAYYFGEVKTDTNLDAYAARSTEDLGKLTPLSNVPEGMKQYPTKGFIIDMGARKALAYFAYAKPDRYLSLFVLAPGDKFSDLQSRIEDAARAFTIVEPDGPHPGKSFVGKSDDDE